MADVLTIRKMADVYELVENNPRLTRLARWVGIIALGGTFVDAYDFTSLGIGAAQLQSQLHLTATQLGIVTASMALGATLAALFGGYYVDKIGRLKMFLLDLALFVVSAVLAALSPNIEWLIVFRFLMGVGVGLDFPAAFSFISEYVSANRRGKWVQFWTPLWFVAVVFTLLLSLAMYYLGAGADLWRWAVGFGAVPALIVLILRFLYMEESPAWAANQGEYDRAAAILSKMYEQKVVVELNEEVKLHKPGTWASELARMFSPPYTLRSVMVLLLNVTQSIEYNAVTFYLPTISLILFGKQLLTALIGAASMDFFGVIGGLIGVALVYRLGLRRITIVGFSVAIVCLLILGFAANALSPPVAAAFIAIFIAAHAFGQGGTGMSIATLSYPSRMRGTGTGFGQASTRLGSMIGLFFFPPILAALGLFHTLLVIAIVPIIGWIVMVAIRWEPIGKNVEAEADQWEAVALGQGVSAPSDR